VCSSDLARTAKRLGHNDEAIKWGRRAEELREAMLRELRLDDGKFAYYKAPDGSLETRRHNLADALVVLLDIVDGAEASTAVEGYPLTDAGLPLFAPFYPNDRMYHNNSAWPFADEFYLWALERATGEPTASRSLALLARTTQVDGTFHELVDFRNKAIWGSASQIWTAAAFIHACTRAGLKISTGNNERNNA